MDPITQGALGAIAGQAIASRLKTKQVLKEPSSKKPIAAISVMAALAGMSPDLDVLIRSSVDPLLFLIYHRQFTHSLFFVPIGALICSLFLHYIIGKRYQLSAWQSYAVCFAGYATHALIDACTSYGTLLLWPFSHERFAWNAVAVVDLFYTVPILFAIFLGIKLKSSWPALIIITWVLFYPYLGYLQSAKAEQAAHHYLKHTHLSTKHLHSHIDNDKQGDEYSNQQGSKNSNKHNDTQIERPAYQTIYSLSAKPSMSNLVLWKIIYETKERFYVDALRVGIFDSPEDATYFPGGSVEKLDIARDFPWLDLDSQQAKDIERFSWFSMGYVAKDTGTFINTKDFKEPENASPIRVMDIRYSIVPNQISPLWSIGLKRDAEPSEHASYDHHRDVSSTKRQEFFDLLFND